MDSREQNILKTLLYADIFDFPLSKQEIYRFLISEKKEQKKIIFQDIDKLTSQVDVEKNLFFLKGKQDSVKKRLERQKIGEIKLRKAKKIIDTVSFIPSVLFIGISGGLSVKNAAQGDDIDIFVITSKNLLWTTRLFLVILLSILGVYRKRNSKKLKDRICLNMLIDEESIYFGKEKQNLYIAHEIAQLTPIFDKKNIYKSFIAKNKWIGKFLPNVSFDSVSYSKKNISVADKTILYFLKIFFAEKISRFFQLKHMTKHRTNETVRENFLAFHPFDYEAFVLSSYKKRLKEFG